MRVLEWRAESRWPAGQLLVSLGEEGSFATEAQTLLYEAGVSFFGGDDAKMAAHVHGIPASAVRSLRHVPLAVLQNPNTEYEPSAVRPALFSPKLTRRAI